MVSLSAAVAQVKLKWHFGAEKLQARKSTRPDYGGLQDKLFQNPFFAKKSLDPLRG
jgi:hypothetical protein